MSIRKHTVYNLTGGLLPVALSLITIPLYIDLIGDARYGVLAIAWLLLGYFGLFDLGLGRATAQRISSLVSARPEQRATSFWTALAINVGLGVIGGLVIWPVALYFFGHAFNVEDTLRTELGKAILWLVLAVPLATFSGVLTGALEGRAKFLELNTISVTGSALIQLVPLTVAWLHGSDLTWLLPAVVLSRFVTLSALFWRCREHVFKGQPRTVSGTEARHLLTFGGWVTVSALLSPLMTMLDRFAISATLGAKAVTYYTVPFQLVQRSAIIPGALASAVFPRLAAAGPEEGVSLGHLAIGSLAVVMTPIMLTGVFLIEPFLGWWLSPEFAAQAARVGQILFLGYWVNAFAVIPFMQLQAGGRPDLVAKCHLAEVLPYLLSLYAGLHFFGLVGAAAAFSLRTAADCLLLMHWSGHLKQRLVLLCVPALVMLLGLLAVMSAATGSALWWASALGLLAVSLWWSKAHMPLEMSLFAQRAYRRVVAPA